MPQFATVVQKISPYPGEITARIPHPAMADAARSPGIASAVKSADAMRIVAPARRAELSTAAGSDCHAVSRSRPAPGRRRTAPRPAIACPAGTRPAGTRPVTGCMAGCASRRASPAPPQAPPWRRPRRAAFTSSQLALRLRRYPAGFHGHRPWSRRRQNPGRKRQASRSGGTKGTSPGGTNGTGRSAGQPGMVGTVNSCPAGPTARLTWPFPEWPGPEALARPALECPGPEVTRTRP